MSSRSAQSDARPRPLRSRRVRVLSANSCRRSHTAPRSAALGTRVDVNQHVFTHRSGRIVSDAREHVKQVKALLVNSRLP